MMPSDHGSTRFSAWTPPRARLALLVLTLVTSACLAVALTAPTRPVETRAGDTDVDLYRKIVARVHAGELPYDATEHVLRSYDYPVRSVFNYRPPFLPWLLGRLPGPDWGRGLLAGLACVTVVLMYTVLRRDGGSLRAGAGVVLALGGLAYGLVGELYLYSEVWAGTFIALSVCAYALERRGVGFAAGLLALFVRELALPYGVVCLALAWRDGRRREAVAWGAGLAAFAVALLAHAAAVAPRIPPGSGIVNGSGWVHCGGVAFLLATCRVNLFLLAAPGWVTALYLPLALLGLRGERGDTPRRIGLVLALYLGAFSVIGGMFNAYWGLLYAPLLPFGLVGAPEALRDLLAAGFGRARTAEQPLPFAARF